ncbi:MAG: hypothetical protein JW969_02145, partial [Spirochaetales bacterium]|nr:hypothetical protein [Spirochaetales bacterium]
AQHAANTSNAHTFGTGSGEYAEGNHNHDSVYAGGNHTHQVTNDAASPTTVNGRSFKFNGATLSETGGVVTISGYEPAFTKNTAFNKNFGTGNTEVARGDHNHGTTYAAAGHNHDTAYAAVGHNHDGSYALKLFFNQVVNPALSPNGGPAGSNPGEAEILIADNAATKARIQALMAAGETIVVKGFSVENASTTIELVITGATIYHDVPTDNYYLRFHLSDGTNNYRPTVAPWMNRQCFITYFLFN